MMSAAESPRSHREIWASKPVLREVYGHLYRRVSAARQAGLTIEVGGGSGNLKHFAPDVFSCDIVCVPWLDFVADAQVLPFRSASIANLVMFDVLHHIEYPIRFLREAARVLQTGGRIICVEPGISPVSGVFYRALHHEPVDVRADPLIDGVPNPDKDPTMGNQAILTLLIKDHAARLTELEPSLVLISARWMSLFAYPLSGGFKSWSLLTPGMARMLLRIEDRLEGVLGPLCGFRLMAIFEKRAVPGR